MLIYLMQVEVVACDRAIIFKAASTDDGRLGGLE